MGLIEDTGLRWRRSLEKSVQLTEDLAVRRASIISTVIQWDCDLERMIWLATLASRVSCEDIGL